MEVVFIIFIEMEWLSVFPRDKSTPTDTDVGNSWVSFFFSAKTDRYYWYYWLVSVTGKSREAVLGYLQLAFCFYNNRQ
jgi:hypothetical protein